MRVYETSEEKKMRKPKLTPELRHSAYLAFQNIRQRCTNRNNKDFEDYGGRGIECVLSQEESSQYTRLPSTQRTCPPHFPVFSLVPFFFGAR